MKSLTAATVISCFINQKLILFSTHLFLRLNYLIGPFRKLYKSLSIFVEMNIYNNFSHNKSMISCLFQVLLAELRDTEYYYAVKCLKKDVVLEDDDVECTLIERKVLALGTNHPYLCHLFATFQTDVSKQ